jgi:predicted Fe-S protein YdhL (DUF1289 family)
MPLGSPKTPCIGLCEMSEGWGICLGCGRRIEEIMDWSDLTDQERETIILETRDRLKELYGKD